jgi:hypothetical protein
MVSAADSVLQQTNVAVLQQSVRLQWAQALDAGQPMAIQVRHAHPLRASTTRATDMERSCGEVMVLLKNLN